MRKTLLTLAALITLAAPASAETTVYQAGDDRLSVSCYHGAYGWQCRSWWNGTGNAARVISVAPAEIPANTNPAWGRGCRSCADTSK